MGCVDACLRTKLADKAAVADTASGQAAKGPSKKMASTSITALTKSLLSRVSGEGPVDGAGEVVEASESVEVEEGVAEVNNAASNVGSSPTRQLAPPEGAPTQAPVSPSSTPSAISDLSNRVREGVRSFFSSERLVDGAGDEVDGSGSVEVGEGVATGNNNGASQTPWENDEDLRA